MRILLINLGSPKSLSIIDVKEYLREFLSDDCVIDLPKYLQQIILKLFILPFRPQKTKLAYEQIWSEKGSPLINNTKLIANKLKKSEGRIDWTRESAQIECQIRGLNPWPGVWFEFDGHRIKVLVAHIGFDTGLAGTVVKSPLNIACGKGSICIDRVQRAGRDPMDVQDFVRGSSIAVGTLLT